MAVRATAQLALLIFMALMAQGKEVLADDSAALCDQRFERVDTRLPAHMLPPGVAARALNRRFEDGRAWERYAVDQQPWGWVLPAIPGESMDVANIQYVGQAPASTATLQVTAGITYFIQPGLNENGVLLVNGTQQLTLTNQMAVIVAQTNVLQFISQNIIPASAEYGSAPAAEYQLGGLNPATSLYIIWGANDQNANWGNNNYRSGDGNEVMAGGGNNPVLTLQSFVIEQPVTAQVYLANGTALTASIWASTQYNVCGYKRFQDPEGLDTTVVLTDDWRNQPGEDGGRGRAWRIFSNNVPQQIPMNGNDIYGIARLIPCQSGLVMFRQDAERHYFPAANVAPGAVADAIQLNCEPDWNDGDQVQLVGDPTQNSTFTGGSWPGSGGYCYVNDIGNNQVKLYKDPGLTQPYTFTGAIGRFYLERAATLPGQWGNGAWPLICQPGSEGQLMWDEGFTGFPAQVFVTAINSNLVSAANHRLIAGDTINYYPATAGGQITGVSSNGATTWYACPVGPNNLYIYTTLNDALANTGNNYAMLPSFVAGQFIVKTTAFGQPMPPCREGFYTQQGCLVGVNGQNNIVVSLPNDPLHTIPLSDSLTADLGEADEVVAVSQLPNQDALIILKELEVFVLYSFAEGLANNGQSWTLDPVTREYGCIAPLSVQPVGSNLFFLSARGVDRVEVNAFGEVFPVLLPPSDNQLAYMDQVDLTDNAAGAVAETWNKRYFIAMPSRGQAAGAAGVLTNAIVGGPQNNLVMTCNLRYTDEAKDVWGWEGLWNGFTVYGFARLTIAGQGERLTFCDYDGNVNWLSDGWLDYGLNAINTQLLTRRYNGGTMGRKIWGPGRIIWDTYDADLAVTAIAPGVNRQYAVTLPGYTATEYIQGPNVPTGYNPATQQPPFNTPFRADYTPQQLSEVVGNALEQRQNITQPYRLRVDAWGIQIQITNTSGSCRIASVMAGGLIGPSADRLQAG